MAQRYWRFWQWDGLLILYRSLIKISVYCSALVCVCVCVLLTQYICTLLVYLQQELEAIHKQLKAGEYNALLIYFGCL